MLNHTGSDWACMFQIGCYSSEFNFCQLYMYQTLCINNTGGGTVGLNTGSLPNAGFTPKILSYQKDYNKTGTAWINGINQKSNTSAGQIGAFTNGNYSIGQLNGGCYTDAYHGDIARIIIFNRVLSNYENQLMIRYLNYTYGIY